MFYLHFTDIERQIDKLDRSTSQWEGEDSFATFKEAQLAMVRQAQRFFRGILKTKAKHIKYLWSNDHSRVREIRYTRDNIVYIYRVAIRQDVNMNYIMYGESPTKEPLNERD